MAMVQCVLAPATVVKGHTLGMRHVVFGRERWEEWGMHTTGSSHAVSPIAAMGTVGTVDA
jgi:hypothetical protein